MEHLPFWLQIVSLVSGGLGFFAFILSAVDYYNKYSYPKVVFGLYPQLNPQSDGKLLRGIVTDVVGFLPESFNNNKENDFFRQFGVLIITGKFPVSIISINLENESEEVIKQISFSPAPPLVFSHESQKILYILSRDFASDFSGNDIVRATVILSGRMILKEKFYSKYVSIKALKESFEKSHEIVLPHAAFKHATKYDTVFTIPGGPNIAPSEVIKEYEAKKKQKK